MKKTPPVLTDGKASSGDPLSDFEKEAPDFTGVCLSHADASMQLADPETEINSSGRSIIQIEDEYDPETEISSSGRSIIRLEEEYDPETESNCSGRSVLLADGEDNPATGIGIKDSGVGRQP